MPRVKDLLRATAYRLPVVRSLAAARAERINRRTRKIVDPATLHAFWRQPEPDGNAPAAYVKPLDRSRVLALLLEGTPRAARILEVGCNVGRNLAYLADSGYRSLEGVEINEHAVDLLRRTYPQLADSTVYVGSAEDVLPTLEGYDLIYTMAVLTHIHPSSTAVFDELCRLAPSLLLIEPAPGREFDTTRAYPHDLRRLFERRGFRLVSLERLSDQRWQPVDAPDYAAWRFERNPTGGG
jgi:SAM-dependent methyltransferase